MVNFLVNGKTIKNYWLFEGFFEVGRLGEYTLKITGYYGFAKNDVITIGGYNFYIQSFTCLDTQISSYVNLVLLPFEDKKISGIQTIQDKNLFVYNEDYLFHVYRRNIDKNVIGFDNKIGLYSDYQKNIKTGLKVLNNSFVLSPETVPNPYGIYNEQYQLKYCAFRLSNYRNDDYIGGRV